MKKKQWVSILLVLALLITCIPTSTVKADELADGQIIPDGVYYVQNKLSGNYMTVEDGIVYNDGAMHGTIMEDTKVVHQFFQLSNTGNPNLVADKRTRLLGSWKVKYLGDGKYSIRPMHKLDMALCANGYDTVIRTIGTADTLVDVPVVAQWTIESTSNGFVIQNDGADSRTLFAEHMGRETYPDTLLADYIEDVPNCHWTFICDETPVTDILFYSDIDLLDDTNLTILSGRTYSLRDLGIAAVGTCPEIHPTEDITWSSNNATIATVDPVTGGITAISPGEVTITATCNLLEKIISHSFDLIVDFRTDSNNDIEEGTYFINNAASEEYLNALSPTFSVGSAVSTGALSGAISQKWLVEYIGNDFYTISLKTNGDVLYLGINRNMDTNTLEIGLRGTNNSYQTWWKATETSSGNYWLSPGYSQSVGYLAASSNGLTLTSSPSSNACTWEFTRMLPLSGYELDYTEYLWGAGVEETCNCYAYAINNQLTKDGNVWFKQQPGAYDGGYNLTLQNIDPYGEIVLEATAADFEQFSFDNNEQMIFMEVDKYEVCPVGTYKVALAVGLLENYQLYDYHWYRQDSDGLWSHKLALDPITRVDKSNKLIIDPETANRGIYTNFIGYYAVTPWNRFYIADMSISNEVQSENEITLTSVTSEQLNQIEIGMTQEQIIEILGSTGTIINCEAILYAYHVDSQTIILNYCTNGNGQLILMSIITQ